MLVSGKWKIRHKGTGPKKLPAQRSARFKGRRKGGRGRGLGWNSGTVVLIVDLLQKRCAKPAVPCTITSYCTYNTVRYQAPTNDYGNTVSSPAKDRSRDVRGRYHTLSRAVCSKL